MSQFMSTPKMMEPAFTGRKRSFFCLFVITVFFQQSKLQRFGLNASQTDWDVFKIIITVDTWTVQVHLHRLFSLNTSTLLHHLPLVKSTDVEQQIPYSFLSKVEESLSQPPIGFLFLDNLS